jgi:hypothetical protein
MKRLDDIAGILYSALMMDGLCLLQRPVRQCILAPDGAFF